MMVPERLIMSWCIIRQQTAMILEELITICNLQFLFFWMSCNTKREEMEERRSIGTESP